MALRRIVRQRQAAWIENAGVRPKGFEEARRFERQKTAVGAGPQRAIKQQHAGTVAKLDASKSLANSPPF